MIINDNKLFLQTIPTRARVLVLGPAGPP